MLSWVVQRGQVPVTRSREFHCSSTAQRYAFRMRSRLRTWIMPVIVVLTIVVLVRFPLADCFDCEGPHPWGRDDVAYLSRSHLFTAWLFGISFLLGICRARFGWVAPLLIAVGDCLTQHIGGVSWWSLLNNEGPFILLGDSFIGLVGLALGGFTQFLILKTRAASQT